MQTNDKLAFSVYEGMADSNGIRSFFMTAPQAKHPISPETEDHNPSSSPPRPGLQSPIRKHSNPFAATLAYFSEPLAYTARSVARRLSEDEPPSALGLALSANHNGSLEDATTGVYHPPTIPERRASPFQPPPLTPLDLKGYKAGTRSRAKLMSKALAEEIRLLVPPRLQLCDHWDLLYSVEQNGSTLSTLYSLCEKYRGKRGGFVVTVKDSGGNIFGGYLSEPPKVQPHYFGSGECFPMESGKITRSTRSLESPAATE